MRELVICIVSIVRVRKSDKSGVTESKRQRGQGIYITLTSLTNKRTRGGQLRTEFISLLCVDRRLESHSVSHKQNQLALVMKEVLQLPISLTTEMNCLSRSFLDLRRTIALQ